MTALNGAGTGQRPLVSASEIASLVLALRRQGIGEGEMEREIVARRPVDLDLLAKVLRRMAEVEASS